MIGGMNFVTKALLAGGAGTAALGSAWRGMGAAGRSAIIGAGIGAGVNAFMGDSVLGGAAMGAVGGLGVRWGRAGLRAANRTLGPKSSSIYGLGSAFFGGASRRFIRDIKGPSMLANRGYNKIRSTLKAWG